MQFVFCSLKRGPPHSTNVLLDVKNLIRSLARSSRTLGIHGSFLFLKMHLHMLGGFYSLAGLVALISLLVAVIPLLAW